VVLVALGLGACDDGGDEPPPSFTEVNERVFQPGCVFSSCHQGASAAGDMSLEGSPHARIVDVPSMQMPSLPRVAPGDPDGSYMVEKLEQDMPAMGTRMPPTAPLDQERIDLVRAWIEAGALDD
jgi:hypothetical protein